MFTIAGGILIAVAVLVIGIPVAFVMLNVVGIIIKSIFQMIAEAGDAVAEFVCHPVKVLRRSWRADIDRFKGPNSGARVLLYAYLAWVAISLIALCVSLLVK